MAGRLDDYLGLHTTALQLRSQRASLIASNLANSDTPNYKARDIDFASTLAQATGQSLSVKTTNPAHLPTGGQATAGSQDVMYRVPNHASLDGNTVDVQVEQGKFSENSLQYQSSLNFLNRKINGLIRTLRSE